MSSAGGWCQKIYWEELGGKRVKVSREKKGIVGKEKLYIMKFNIYTRELTRYLVTLLLGINFSVFTLCELKRY